MARISRVKVLVPNGLTILNLIFGFLSIINSLEGKFQSAALLIILAALSDAFDGKAARKINITTKLGAELDSLADMVSFGVASGVLIYVYNFSAIDNGVYIVILGVVCTAIRLARFNVASDPDYFTGMPSPAFGFFVATYVLSGLQLSNMLLIAIFASFSLLMISNVKYPTFKRINLKVGIGVGAVIGILILAIALGGIEWIILPFFVYAILGPLFYRIFYRR